MFIDREDSQTNANKQRSKMKSKGGQKFYSHCISLKYLAPAVLSLCRRRHRLPPN
jgi:hypothetical protein